MRFIKKYLKAIASSLVCLLVLISLFLIWRNLVNTSAPKAALVSMVHQKSMNSVIELIRNVEDRFNNRYGYDWVLLSEEDFSETFTETVKAFVTGNIHFRTINRKRDWKMPQHISRSMLLNKMHELDINGVPDGGSNTFRIRSNFLTNAITEYLPEYRYFAYISPDTRLYCNMQDFFAEMNDKKLKMAFTVSQKATPHSTNELNDIVSEFIKDKKEIIKDKHWVDSFIEPGSSFCEFSYGFIAWDLKFLRSPDYAEWYKKVDETGGIFYSRWSTSSVQALAAALFLDPQEVHFLGNVGLYDAGKVSCPTSKSDRLRHQCTCPFDPRMESSERNQIFTYTESSCTPRFLKLRGDSFQPGWESYGDTSYAA